MADPKTPVVDPAADQSDRQAKAVASMAATKAPSAPAPAPVEPEEKVVVDLKSDQCPNCGNHGVVSKLVDGVCEACGFDKSALSNVMLEPGRKV